MAINPESQYPGKIAPSSAAYPYGQARNITVPGDGTGTPWEAAIVNDFLGHQQALLSAAGLVPSGNPDQVGASQYLEAQLDMHGRVYQSVDGLKNRTDSLKVGQVVATPRTKWVITDQGTYTHPDVSRSRTFNNLDIGSGLYAMPAERTIYCEDFLDDSTTASNDTEVGEISSILFDGVRLDFNGKMFRVYANTTGITSSGATPATDRAQALNEMLVVSDVNNITLGPGGLYVADQGTAPAKSYFPSTIFFKNCTGIYFEPGSIFEGKGESWGDSDASISLAKSDRIDFLGQNGGHAVVFCRCRRVRGTPTARLCGSVGPLYFSSSGDIALDGPFVNAASLGYATYTFDAWVGSLADTGMEDFSATINNPVSHRETLVRREDGTTAVGSSTFCGKGGILTEDEGVYVVSHGGYIADMYANGSDRGLGYAFGSAAGAVTIANHPIIRNCQEAAYVNWSVDDLAVCNVLNMDAELGLCVAFFEDKSFGSGEMTVTGKAVIDGSRTWVGQPEPLSTTSVVAAMKVTSQATCNVNMDISGDVYALVNNNDEALYGGVFIDGGRYELNGYIIRSQGWGGSGADSKKGLVIRGGAQIIDNSAETDSLFQYTNQSTGTSTATYFYHDLRDCNISSNTWRSVDWTPFNAGTLEERRLYPLSLENCYSTSNAAFEITATKGEFLSHNGLSGPNTRGVFRFNENRLPKNVRAYIVTDTTFVRLLGFFSAADTSFGDLRNEILLEGDVRTDFTTNTEYSIMVFGNM